MKLIYILTADFEHVNVYLHFLMMLLLLRNSHWFVQNFKIFCLLTLSNPVFDCYVYILGMVTSLLLDFTVHFDNFISIEDGCL